MTNATVGAQSLLLYIVRNMKLCKTQTVPGFVINGLFSDSFFDEHLHLENENWLKKSVIHEEYII